MATNTVFRLSEATTPTCPAEPASGTSLGRPHRVRAGGRLPVLDDAFGAKVAGRDVIALSAIEDERGR
jgi:hypothetical protein